MTMPSLCGCYEDTAGFHLCAMHGIPPVGGGPTPKVDVTITLVPNVSADPEAGGVPEPTLAQMRAWLEEEKVLSANGRRTAMLAAILAALGELERLCDLEKGLEALVSPTRFHGYAIIENEAVPVDELWWLDKDGKLQGKLKGLDAPLTAAAPRPTEEKPDAH